MKLGDPSRHALCFGRDEASGGQTTRAVALVVAPNKSLKADEAEIKPSRPLQSRILAVAACGRWTTGQRLSKLAMPELGGSGAVRGWPRGVAAYLKITSPPRLLAVMDDHPSAHVREHSTAANEAHDADARRKKQAV